MQQQEFGPDRRALMAMVMKDVMETREAMASAAVCVCDRLMSRGAYQPQLERFQQLDARRMAMWARWDQLKQEGE
ncbi:hypothetical protein [Aquitalea pelogenes]|uniref:hypothetical protein n=1 Tax=Aquitalea pelogenes TaxID=1293573 RepID=UPI0035B391E9